MKLSLKHIQKLEILLKRLLSFNNLDIQLSLVVKIDDSLYSGDFRYHKRCRAYRCNTYCT